MNKQTAEIMQNLAKKSICATYVSPELTLSFQARVESVLDTENNEVVLMLSGQGRIIASGVQLRVSGNGLILDLGTGKRLYITVQEEQS